MIADKKIIKNKYLPYTYFHRARRFTSPLLQVIVYNRLSKATLNSKSYIQRHLAHISGNNQS